MFNLSFEMLEFLKIILDIILGCILGFLIHAALTKFVDKVFDVYNEDGEIRLLFMILPSCFIVLLLWGIVTWMR